MLLLKSGGNVAPSFRWWIIDVDTTDILCHCHHFQWPTARRVSYKIPWHHEVPSARPTSGFLVYPPKSAPQRGRWQVRAEMHMSAGGGYSIVLKYIDAYTRTSGMHLHRRCHSFSQYAGLHPYRSVSRLVSGLPCPGLAGCGASFF